MDVNSLILDKIDPDGFISKRLFKEHCYISTRQRLTKDLSIIGRRPSDTIIMDNSMSAEMIQPEQGIRMPCWLGQKDGILDQWIPCLIQLSQMEDCRDAFRMFKEKQAGSFNQVLEVCYNMLSRQKRHRSSYMARIIEIQEKLQRQQRAKDERRSHRQRK